MGDRHHRIEVYAYELYEYRKNSSMYDFGNIGNELGDWLDAEHIVDAEDKVKNMGISEITIKKMESK